MAPIFLQKSRQKKLFADIKKERNRLYTEIFFNKIGNNSTYKKKKQEYEDLNSYLKNEEILKDIEETTKFTS